MSGLDEQVAFLDICPMCSKIPSEFLIVKGTYETFWWVTEERREKINMSVPIILDDGVRDTSESYVRRLLSAQIRRITCLKCHKDIMINTDGKMRDKTSKKVEFFQKMDEATLYNLKKRRYLTWREFCDLSS
jgi:hypothetical protein